ncbi:phosphatidylinositol 3,4,5-trisphosphate 3-phosphatase TPTE2-like [Pan paniscus]|uniref:phosphatidylinositol 3,4,5-trisphosphate 3-phosphatase TPTE2-like n=1 Tax=Pan paniscus TaxID=9597 RepID=UPI0015610BFF|nr:phosphatidylinositol 3,4,5-trisphosphate 3-phosphatase TPTE2-like [Pan paniscus]
MPAAFPCVFPPQSLQVSPQMSSKAWEKQSLPLPGLRGSPVERKNRNYDLCLPYCLRNIFNCRGVGTGDVCDLKFQIVMEKKVVFSRTSLGNCSILHDIETASILINVYDSPSLYDDVKVQFFSLNLPKYYDNCSFFFWFNTSFIQNNRLYLPRNELDNPHQQKAWKIYPPEFAVEILFGEK